MKTNPCQHCVCLRLGSIPFCLGLKMGMLFCLQRGHYTDTPSRVETYQQLGCHWWRSQSRAAHQALHVWPHFNSEPRWRPACGWLPSCVCVYLWTEPWLPPCVCACMCMDRATALCLSSKLQRMWLSNHSTSFFWKLSYCVNTGVRSWVLQSSCIYISEVYLVYEVTVYGAMTWESWEFE